MRPLTRWLLAALALSAAACPKTAARCEHDAQCPLGQSCSQGVCTSPCSPACGAGQVCDNAKCFPKDCSGQTCPENAFCDSGSCVFHGCRGLRCKQDQTCVTGGACVNTSCGDDACGQYAYCAGQTCADATCYGISCPEGQVCSGAKCHSKDCDGRSCGDSFCADDGYCKDCPGTPPCAIGEECVEGSCQSRDCLADPASAACTNDCKKAGHTCTTSQVCLGTTCVLKNCPNHTCLPGSYCAGWSCISDACLGVTCADGERCAGDGKCQPTSCGDTACPDGQVCPASPHQCVSALCLGVSCAPGWQCWAGGCYSKTGPDGKACPEGQLDIGEACRPAGSSADCGGMSCPWGFTCQGDVCTNVASATTSCDPKTQGVFNGTCYPNSDPVSGPCDPGELYIEGECRATNGDKPILCGSDYCAAGFVCDGGRCADVKCFGVTCLAGQRCADGRCESVDAPDGGSCAPGTLWEDTACKPEPPIAGCGEGCVPDSNGTCVPPECVNGGCGQICGSPRCATFCKADELCDLNGVCHSLCSTCPKGFVCGAGGAPPCLPQGCLQIACPAGTHCVDVGAGPACQPITCAGVVCLPSETCQDDVCVDMTCAGVHCQSNQTCYYGTCYLKCCPEGGQCSDDTLCYVAPGSTGPGTAYSRNCQTKQCPSSELCLGDTCAPLGHLPACQAYDHQPLYCDGLDHDCDGHADDYVFYPNPSTSFAIYPDWDVSQQYLIDREPCTNTSSEGDWDKIGVFDDGYNVYLTRFDSEDATAHPATHVTNSGPGQMSSCIRITMPCSRFMATDLNIKAHGAGSVSCARYFASHINCSGNCQAPYVHIYIRSSSSAHWVDIGDQNNIHNWGDWFQPWLDGNHLHHEDLTDEYWNPRQVQAVLICRDMADNSHASVGIDGVDVVGCCLH